MASTGERPGVDARDDRVPTDAGGLRTFLIADVRGYTRYTQMHGDEAAAQLAAAFAAGARGAVSELGGEVIELRGDEALAVFTSPRQAVRASVEVQRRLRGARHADEALPLGVGIGIDTGEAVPVEGGYRGQALNVAARLCSLAAPGETLATETVVALAGSVPGVRYASRRAVRVKGIAQPVRLIEVAPEGGLPPLVPLEPARRRDRRRIGALAAGAVVIAIAAAVLGLTVLGGEGRAGSKLDANSLGRIDTGSGTVADQVAVGADPTDVVYGGESLWVVNRRDRTLWKVNRRTNAVEDQVPLDAAPVAAAFGDGAVWVADEVTRKVVRVDAATRRVVARYPVGNGPAAVAFTGGAVWVANSVDGTVSRVDAGTGRVRTIPVGVEPVAIAVGEGGVWVANRGSDNVVRIDPDTAAVESISVGHEPSAVAVGGGAVWVANAADGTVWKLDPETASVRDTVVVGTQPRALAFVDGAVWVASEESGTLTKIDRDGGTSAEHVGGGPTALEAADGDLWVTALASRAAHRGGTLRISGPFPITDPDFQSFGANINPLINDGLVAYRSTSGPGGTTLVPDLATEVPVPTDDGKTYTFHVRDGIRYSTGAEVKPSDVRASLERMFAVRADFAPNLETIRGAPACLERPADCDLGNGVVTDDEDGTVTFRLEHPDPLFLHKLAYPPAYVLPADVPRRKMVRQPLPATGPYQIARVTASRMTLMRNPHFREWSRDAQPAGFPDRIVITDPGRPDVPLRLVRSGRADAMVGEIGPDVARQLGVRFPTRLHSVPDPSVVFAVLSNQRPPFDDARVRRAVNLAVDRRAAVAALGGPLFGRPLCQMIPPNVLGFRPTCSFTRGSAAGVWSAPDVDAARRLVAASGTRGTAVTVWTSVEEPLRGLADVLAATLRRLGYPTRVRVVPGSRFDYYGAAATPRNHAQIGPFRWGLDAPVPMDVFGPLLTCDGVNRVFFCDPAFDRRVEAAAGLTATDQKAAADRWAALDREVIERAVVAPLATQSHVEFVSARVGNFQDHPVWGPLYGQLWVR